MIAEARSDWYFILDGDEVYSKESVKAIDDIFPQLVKAHSRDDRKIYGVLNRVEIGNSLKERYDEERTHHRIYHRTAIWTGNHPGEVPFYEQLPKREFVFPSAANCYHFHNAARSPMDLRH